MSGDNRKRKDNPISSSHLSLGISTTFRPATFQPPAYQPYVQESGCTPLTIQSATYQPTTFHPYAQHPMFQNHTSLLNMLGILEPMQQQQKQQQQQSSPQQSTQQQSSPQQSTPQQSTQQQSMSQQSLTQQSTPQHSTTQQQSTPQQFSQQQSPPQDQEEQYHTVHRRRRKYNPEVKYLGKKILIYHLGKGLEPSTDVASFVTKAIKAVYKFFYPTYDELIKADWVKEEMLEVLSSNCTCEPHHHEDVKNNFEYLAGQGLKDMLYDARETYKVKHDPPNHPYGPNWIGEEAWQKLLHYWETDETFNKRSQANKGNRNSSKGGFLHTQGSVSIVSHAQQLIKEKGPNIDIPDVHKETHTKKSTGGYVDQRSETTQRLYDDSIEKFLQNHPEYSIREAIPGPIRRDIWLEVTGPGTKNSKYGFGKLASNVRHENLLHIPTPEERSRPVALSPAAQAEIQRLTQELQAQRDELKRQQQMMQEMMQQEIRRAMEEQTRAMDQQRREMNAYFMEMLASSKNAPIVETEPHEDSTNSNNEDTHAN